MLDLGPTHGRIYTFISGTLQASLRIRAVSPEALLFAKSFIKAYCLLKANSKASGETARMRRLAWSFAVCICPKALSEKASQSYGPLGSVLWSPWWRSSLQWEHTMLPAT